MCAGHLHFIGPRLPTRVTSAKPARPRAKQSGSHNCQMESDDLIGHTIQGISLRRAGLSRFRDMSEVHQWVNDHGGGAEGELALRNAIAKVGPNTPHSGLVYEWLEQQERKRSDAHVVASLEIDRRAAQAAERSASASERAARYAMWSAAISGSVGVVSAAAYWLSRAG
jgi:hypothetical protein